jgi:two-component system nitrate/nitrite response regulator NarL
MRGRAVATVVVGPSALLREGLTKILGTANFRIVASAAAVDKLALMMPRHRSILLVIDAGDDLRAAVQQNGLFREQHPAGRVAILADHDQPSDIVAAFRGGANAFFVKVASCAAFLKALELVMLGETILPAAVLSMILDGADSNEDDRHQEAVAQGVSEPVGEYLGSESNDMPRLSVREKCILNCLIAGESNKVIARKIEIAEATVKVHIKAILRKIRVHNRTQAAIWAMNNGSSISATDSGSSVPGKAGAGAPHASHLVRNLPATRQNGSAVLPAVTGALEAPAPAELSGASRVVRVGINRRSY